MEDSLDAVLTQADKLLQRYLEWQRHAEKNGDAGLAVRMRRKAEFLDKAISALLNAKNS